MTVGDIIKEIERLEYERDQINLAIRTLTNTWTLKAAVQDNPAINLLQEKVRELDHLIENLRNTQVEGAVVCRQPLANPLILPFELTRYR